MSQINQIDPANLVWLDESGIDEFLQRDYARSSRGNQVISEVYGRKYGRVSVVAAWISPHFINLKKTQELIESVGCFETKIQKT